MSDWVDDVAEGAALMPQTDVNKRYLSGCHSTLHNGVISEVIYDNLQEHSLTYTDDQRAFAAELNATFEEEAIPSRLREEVKLSAERNEAIAEHDFYTEPIEIVDDGEVVAGSTDVGDVSLIVPTAEFYAATWPVGTPAHTWQAMAANGSFGAEAMVYAAKVLFLRNSPPGRRDAAVRTDAVTGDLVRYTITNADGRGDASNYL